MNAVRGGRHEHDDSLNIAPPTLTGYGRALVLCQPRLLTAPYRTGRHGLIAAVPHNFKTTPRLLSAPGAADNRCRLTHINRIGLRWHGWVQPGPPLPATRAAAAG